MQIVVIFIRRVVGKLFVLVIVIWRVRKLIEVIAVMEMRVRRVPKLGRFELIIELLVERINIEMLLALTLMNALSLFIAHANDAFNG